MPTKKKSAKKAPKISAIARAKAIVAKNKKTATKKTSAKKAKKAPAKRGRKAKGGVKTPVAKLLKKHKDPRYPTYLKRKAELSKEIFG